MPIFRLKEKIVYFCHVPKCGGTSVEDYLENRYGALSFLDRHWEELPRKYRWSRTSPQHIEKEAAARVFDPSFIDYEFGMVRNPAKRFLSAFRHARRRGSIPQWIDAHRLLSQIENASDNFHKRTDNHFRPASDFLGSRTHVFKLEDGGHDLIDWLDELEGKRGKVRALPVKNRAHEIPRAELATASATVLSLFLPNRPIETEMDSKLANRVFDVYRQDFGRLKYASPGR